MCAAPNGLKKCLSAVKSKSKSLTWLKLNIKNLWLSFNHLQKINPKALLG